MAPQNFLNIFFTATEGSTPGGPGKRRRRQLFRELHKIQKWCMFWYVLLTVIYFTLGLNSYILSYFFFQNILFFFGNQREEKKYYLDIFSLLVDFHKMKYFETDNSCIFFMFNIFHYIIILKVRNKFNDLLIDYDSFRKNLDETRRKHHHVMEVSLTQNYFSCFLKLGVYLVILRLNKWFMICPIKYINRFMSARISNL